MRERFVAAILAGVGVAGFLGAYVIYQEREAQLAKRPEASGDVGTIVVYAQREIGPFRLSPGRRYDLKRPQDLSFQWTANGTGPRHMRIEMHSEGRTALVHEERLSAPADKLPLGYVLTLDESYPDQLELVVALEAPHSVGYESRYPLTITGATKRPLE